MAKDRIPLEDKIPKPKRGMSSDTVEILFALQMMAIRMDESFSTIDEILEVQSETFETVETIVRRQNELDKILKNGLTTRIGKLEDPEESCTYGKSLDMKLKKHEALPHEITPVPDTVQRFWIAIKENKFKSMVSGLILLSVLPFISFASIGLLLGLLNRYAGIDIINPIITFFTGLW